MEFILGIFALICCYGVYHFFFDNAVFLAFLSEKVKQPVTGKFHIAVIVSFLFAVWGTVAAQKAASMLAICFCTFVAGIWLASPEGQKWLKEKIG